MRTLSANIAVEIPEAPVGGTLFRVLFLCAVLLFLLTFTLNTLAEVVRQRLRSAMAATDAAEPVQVARAQTPPPPRPTKAAPASGGPASRWSGPPAPLWPRCCSCWRRS